MGVGDGGRYRAVGREVVDRDLDGDAVDVDPGGGVDSVGHLAEAGVGQSERRVVLLERPQDAEVEDGSEVDVEALRSLAGEDPGPRGDGHDGVRGQRRVVGCRERSDVARWARHAGGEHLGIAAVVDPGDRVGLASVPCRVTQTEDRPGVVEEGIRVGDLAGEPELIGDVGPAVAVVVDVDLVEDVVAEFEEVGTAVRTLEGYVVGDQGHTAAVGRADEGVEVAGVGDRVLRDLGGFTMRGHDLPRILIVDGWDDGVRGRGAIGVAVVSGRR